MKYIFAIWGNLIMLSNNTGAVYPNHGRWNVTETHQQSYLGIITIMCEFNIHWTFRWDQRVVQERWNEYSLKCNQVAKTIMKQLEAIDLKVQIKLQLTYQRYQAGIPAPMNSPSPPWWRHQMETFSALLAICARNSPVTGEFPAQRPVTPSFDGFFDLRPNKRLSKQSWGWWFETYLPPLWRHSNTNERMVSIFSCGLLCANFSLSHYPALSFISQTSIF